MRSTVQTREISSTVSYRARCSACAFSRPYIRATASRPMFSLLETQPPFRPEAPKPAIRRSTIATRSEGSRFSK